MKSHELEVMKRSVAIAADGSFALAKEQAEALLDLAYRFIDVSCHCDCGRRIHTSLR